MKDVYTAFATDSYYSDATRAKMKEAIDRNNRLKSELNDLGLPHFQPSIVYAPPGSTDVWLAEINDNFKHRHLRSFLSAASTSQKAAMGTDFPGNARDLEAYVLALPVNDRRTADVVVVTSYTTAASRFLRHWIEVDNNVYPITRLSRTECQEAGIDILEFEMLRDHGRAAKREGLGKHTYELRIRPGLFGNSMWDEVHRLKNIQTQQLYTLLKMKHGRVLMLTASPFCRRVKDLVSILRVIAETSVGEIINASSASRVQSVEDYVKKRQLLLDNGGSYLSASAAVRAELVMALDPIAYDKIMSGFDDSPAIVRRVVPAALAIVALRRVTGQKVFAQGRDVTIAGDLPPFHCTIVELAPNEREALLYNRAHQAKFAQDETIFAEAEKHPVPIDPPQSMLASDDNEIEARENIDKRRRLQTASNNAGMDNLFEFKVDADAKDVQKWYDEHAGESGAFAFYYTATNPGWGLPPADRVGQAHYVVHPSAKCQYVLKEALRLAEKGEKLLVYCDWPTSVWLNKNGLNVLCMKAARISAGQTAKERAHITKVFNDPESQEIMILVASSRSAAESYNFQKDCHNIIVMDVVNFNVLLQIIGRCYRIGQKHEQFIKVLTLDRSYDQYLLSKYATAMVAQLAATSGALISDVTDEECGRRLKDPVFARDVEKTSGLTHKSTIEEAREAIYNEMVHAKLRRNFGLRSDRDNFLWQNPNQVDGKLLIPSEQQFYLSLGGKTAERVNHLLHLAQDPSGFKTPPSRGVSDHVKKLEDTEKRKKRQQTIFEAAAKKRKLDEDQAEKAETKKRKRTEKIREMLAKDPSMAEQLGIPPPATLARSSSISDLPSSPPPHPTSGLSHMADSTDASDAPADTPTVNTAKLASELVALSAKQLIAIMKAVGAKPTKTPTKKADTADVILTHFMNDIVTETLAGKGKGKASGEVDAKKPVALAEAMAKALHSGGEGDD